MEHRAVPRHHVGFGIVFALVAMALSFLAVVVFSSNAKVGSAAQAQYAQAASDECASTNQVRTFPGNQNQTTEPFRITSDRFRLAVDTTGQGRLEVVVLNEQGESTGQRFEVGGDGSRIIPLGPGTFRLQIREEGNVSSYSVTVEDCLAANNVAVDQVTTDQITAETTADTNTAAADATADAEAQVADELTGAAGAEGAFRCELFLRIDDGDGFDGRFFNRRGNRFAGWLQYFDGDEDLLVRRIEQCREREVLTDTIPNRNLPDTGGSPLALFAASVLVVSGLFAGASVIRAGTRRRR
jgi:hypothetical protein